MRINLDNLDKLITAPDPLSTEPWEVSLGELVRKTGKVPKIATKPLDLFDRFGALRLTPDEIGFDNDMVEWGKIVELRAHTASSLLTGKALDREVDRIRGYLPPIPGRKWAVNKVVTLLLDLTMAVTGDYATKAADTVDRVGADEGGAEDARLVTEIVYRGRFGRTKEVQAGMIGALITLRPGVNTCLREMAGIRGVPVVDSEDDHFDDAVERGTQLRNRFGSLQKAAERFRRDMDETEDEPAEDEPGGDIAPTDTAATA